MISKYYKGIQKKVYLPHSSSILEIQLMEFSSNTDICVVTPGMGGGGYSDIFTHTYARAILGGSNLEFQYLFFFSLGGGGGGGFEKMNIFGRFCGYFGGSSQN